MLKFPEIELNGAYNIITGKIFTGGFFLPPIIRENECELCRVFHTARTGGGRAKVSAITVKISRLFSPTTSR